MTETQVRAMKKMKLNFMYLCLGLFTVVPALKSQSIFLESQINLNELIEESSRYELKAKLDFDGDSNDEFFVTNTSLDDHKYFVFDIKSSSIVTSFDSPVFEGTIGDTDQEFSICFKGNKKSQLFLERGFWKENRVYDIEVDDVLKLDLLIDHKISILDLNLDGYPEVVGTRFGKDTTRIFSFINETRYDTLLEVNHELKSIHAVQLDDDMSMELVLLGWDESYIVDPFDGEMMTPDFPVSSFNELIAYDDDNNRQFLFLYGNDDIEIYNSDMEVELYDFKLPYSYRKPNVKLFYTESDSVHKPYFAVLNDDFTIFDNMLDTLFVLEDVGDGWSSFDDDPLQLFINDLDGDQNPNFIFENEGIIFNYEIEGLGKFYDPFQIYDHYPHYSQEIKSLSNLFLSFDTDVDTDTLKKYTVLRNNETNEIIETQISTVDQRNFYFSVVDPIPNGSYTFEIEPALHSIHGEKLDINKDDHYSDKDKTSFHLDFEVLNSVTNLPSINVLSDIPDSLYINSKHEFWIRVESQEEDTPLLSVVSGFENDVLADLNPEDKVFNASEERMKVLIDTNNKGEGLENFKIVAEGIDGIKDSLVKSIQLILKKGSSFPVKEANIYRTSKQDREISNNQFELKWYLQKNIDGQKLVGESGFIYFVNKDNNSLTKFNCETGESMWEFPFEDEIGEMYIENDRLYVIFSVDSNLFVACIHVMTGQMLWESRSFHTYSNGSAYQLDITVVRDYVILPTPHGIWCLNRWNGLEIWQRPDENIRRQVIVHNDLVYSVGCQGIQSLDINTGALRGCSNGNGASAYNGSLLFDEVNDQLIYEDSDGIYSVDIMSLEQNWFVPQFGLKHLTISDSRLLYYVDNQLHEVNLESGSVVNTVPIKYSKTSDDVLMYGDFLMVSNTFPDSAKVYDLRNLQLINGIEESRGGEITFVDNYLVLNKSWEIQVFEMLPPCFSKENMSAHICQGESIDFNGEVYSESGLIVDTIYQANGCHVISELELFVSNTTLVDSTIIDDTGSGLGLISIDVNGGVMPYSFIWSNGATTSTIDSLDFGNYSVTITDSIGCMVSFGFAVEDVECIDQGGDMDGDGFCADQDCDDNNSDVNPNQVEIPYNGLDDDCNSETLDDDLDQDGYELSEDCDDSDPLINPGVLEIVYNGIDDDCNSETLDDDLDQDGYEFLEDCDDNNALINPGVIEIEYNGQDDDCDSTTLDDDLDQDGYVLSEDCDDSAPLINPGVLEIVYNGIDDDCNSETLDDDLDQDGFTFVEDCDDLNPEINPLAVDIPNNGIDEDCDGMDLVSSLDDLNLSALKIYPNPTSNYIYLDSRVLSDLDFSIYDLTGKSQMIPRNGKTLDVHKLSSGTYFLTITHVITGSSVTKKFVVLK